MSRLKDIILGLQVPPALAEGYTGMAPGPFLPDMPASGVGTELLQLLLPGSAMPELPRAVPPPHAPSPR